MHYIQAQHLKDCEFSSSFKNKMRIKMHKIKTFLTNFPSFFAFVIFLHFHSFTILFLFISSVCLYLLYKYRYVFECQYNKISISLRSFFAIYIYLSYKKLYFILQHRKSSISSTFTCYISSSYFSYPKKSISKWIKRNGILCYKEQSTINVAHLSNSKKHTQKKKIFWSQLFLFFYLLHNEFSFFQHKICFFWTSIYAARKCEI